MSYKPALEAYCAQHLNYSIVFNVPSSSFHLSSLFFRWNHPESSSSLRMSEGKKMLSEVKCHFSAAKNLISLYYETNVYHDFDCTTFICWNKGSFFTQTFTTYVLIFSKLPFFFLFLLLTSYTIFCTTTENCRMYVSY